MLRALFLALLPSAALAGDVLMPPPPTAEMLAAVPGAPEAKACADAPQGMACIPGGPFLRGTDDGFEMARPQATVWVQTFYMDVDEVTFADYQACARRGRCNKARPKYRDFDRPLQPMNGASWYDAKKYCEAHGKHLPTEAEWEKAARGTDGRLYPWGAEEVSCERAVMMDDTGRSCGVKKKGSHPEKGRVWEVGKKPASLYGLRDMIGNSYEWVADWYSTSYASCGEKCLGVDPKGPCDGAERCKGFRRRVVRGGSWYWGVERNNGVWRRAHVPGNNPYHHFGFRCAASAEEAAKIAAKAAKE